MVCVQGPVYKIQWSPFCPDMFLSCSGDWSIRLWQQDRTEPILTFLSSTVRATVSLCRVLCVGVIMYSVGVMYSVLESLSLLYQCTLCHVHSVTLTHTQSVSLCHVLWQCHCVMYFVSVSLCTLSMSCILCWCRCHYYISVHCCHVHSVTLTHTRSVSLCHVLCQCHCVMFSLSSYSVDVTISCTQPESMCHVVLMPVSLCCVRHWCHYMFYSMSVSLVLQSHAPLCQHYCVLL